MKLPDWQTILGIAVGTILGIIIGHIIQPDFAYIMKAIFK